MNNQYAVIMAGGAGTRLWPLSRRHRPKQVLRLFGDRSLLRLSFDRLRSFMRADQILLIALEEHRDAYLAELPELPAGNYIGEPVGRDTAAAVGLSAAVLHRRDPDAVIGVFTADHVIEPIDHFRAAVERGYAAATEHPGALVTFGIRPTAPLTVYGYVQRGERMGPGLSQVARFKEKPDRATAEKFLAAGDHAWNSGMFVWRAATILDELKRNLRATHDAVCAIAADPVRTSEIYASLQRISIDFAVMEKAREVLVVDMDVHWADVGNWPALQSVMPASGDGNVTAAPHVATLDAKNSIFVCEDGHLLAAIGVDNLVVVHSPDATLVCRREDAERIKDLLAQVQSRFGDRYG